MSKYENVWKDLCQRLICGWWDLGIYIFFFSSSFFFFWPHHMACGILVPRPGLEPPAVEAQSLNHWIARQVPISLSLRLSTFYNFLQ